MFRFLAFLFLSLLLLAACDEDEVRPGPARFSGTLVLVDDSTPLAALDVTLFDPASQTAVGHDISDSTGGFGFGDLVPGNYIPVVHANGFRPLFLPRPQWRLEAGDEVHVEIRMRRAAQVGDSDYRLAGTVIDRETSEPIANARVEMNFVGPGEVNEVNWSEYVGWATTLEDTTDENGEFWLAPVTVLLLEPDFSLYYPEARITAPGYRSAALPANDDPRTANVSFFTVALVRGVDAGMLEGEVRDFSGAPVAGVQVSAEWRQQRRFNRDFAQPVVDAGLGDGILIPDGSATTDASGSFRIAGLPRGFYNLQAGAPPEDGFVGIMTRGIEVPAEGAGRADLLCVRAIRHIAPADGAMLEAVPDRLEFDPVPSATSYRILVTRGQDGHLASLTTEDPFYEFNPGSALFQGGGSFGWSVTAFAEGGAELSISDHTWVFHLPVTTD